MVISHHAGHDHVTPPAAASQLLGCSGRTKRSWIVVCCINTSVRVPWAVVVLVSRYHLGHDCVNPRVAAGQVMGCSIQTKQSLIVPRHRNISVRDLGAAVVLTRYRWWDVRRNATGREFIALPLLYRQRQRRALLGNFVRSANLEQQLGAVKGRQKLTRTTNKTC